MKKHLFICLLGITNFVLFAPLADAQPVAPEFGDVVQITDSELDSRLGRTPKGSLAFDNQGVLHLVYTEQNAEGTGLGTPGLMLYTAYEDGAFSTPLRFRSEEGDGVPFNSGGNPALAPQDDGSVHLVWHDYRYSTSASGGNQTEVYYRKLLPDGQFAADELRLTDNSANSWRPEIVLTPDNRIVVCWYDYSEHGTGDLLYALSGTDQTFPSAIDFNSQLVAAANPNEEGVILPQVAVDSQGHLHFVWTAADISGYSYSNERLVYGVVENPDDRVLTQRQVVSAPATSTTDGGKIAIAADDTIWVAWTNYESDIPNIQLASKAAGATSFSEAITLSENNYPDGVEQSDIAIASDGTVYVVWVDFNAGAGDIFLRIYDPASQSLSEIIQLTTDDFDNDEKPAIAAGPDGAIAIVWERELEEAPVNLAMLYWEGESAVDSWMIFE